MVKRLPEAGLSDCRARLLCSRYAVVAVAMADSTNQAKLCYAIGLLDDGQWEGLGVWPSDERLADVAGRLAADLQERGLQRASLLIAADPEAATLGSSVLRSARWLAPARNCLEPLLPAATRVLPRRFRHTAAAAEVLVQSLNRRLKFALARRRNTLTASSAADFVASLLHRAERVAASGAPTRLDPLG